MHIHSHFLKRKPVNTNTPVVN